MKKAIIGKKVGMTQIFDEAGKVIPVTVIEAGPCVVVQKMTPEKEGYKAVQLGFEEAAEKKLSKPEQGHLNLKEAFFVLEGEACSPPLQNNKNTCGTLPAVYHATSLLLHEAFLH